SAAFTASGAATVLLAAVVSVPVGAPHAAMLQITAADANAASRRELTGGEGTDSVWSTARDLTDRPCDRDNGRRGERSPPARAALGRRGPHHRDRGGCGRHRERTRRPRGPPGRVEQPSRDDRQRAHAVPRRRAARRYGARRRRPPEGA